MMWMQVTSMIEPMFWGIKIWHIHADAEEVDVEINGRMLISNQSRKSIIWSPYHFSMRCYHLENGGLTFALCTVSLVVPTAHAIGTLHRMWLIHRMNIARTKAHYPRQLISPLFLIYKDFAKLWSTSISETHDAQTRSAHTKVAQKAAAATRWKVARGVTTLFCMTRC